MADKSILYDSAFVITPSDTVGYGECSGLYVGGAGNAVVLMADGKTCLISGIPAGTYLPLRHTRINSTSTTATLLVGLR
jgi:hypothetical protein